MARSFRSRREPYPAVPPPSYRHAQPSGPWPWLDLGVDAAAVHSILQQSDENPDETDPTEWSEYPQNLFPNWLPIQVDRCRMKKSDSDTCIIYALDVAKEDGIFREVLDDGATIRRVHNEDANDFWESIQNPRPSDVRLRAIFLDSLSTAVMCALGTKYIIEPFFFSSSMNWIPSRYQEQYTAGHSDHITVVLPFIRAVRNPNTRAPSPTEGIYAVVRPPPGYQMYNIKGPTIEDDEQVINTQKPLQLSSNQVVLVYDQVALHVIRGPDTSTVISYHPPNHRGTTTAFKLHSIMMAAGQSVYWKKIFKRSDDPTFVVLTLLWYPLYAWDETLEKLYEHIGYLESRVIKQNDMRLVRSLHIIQAHLLHYGSLMEEFRKSILFVTTTPYPALEDTSYDEAKRADSRVLMQQECDHILSQIERLEQTRQMQSDRLKNVMDLAFAMVNIQDSKDMRKLTEATVRDSAAMKQISYLTMFFLPASFVATVFGMNVKEINGSLQPVWHYVVLTVCLTLFTVWLIGALEADRLMTMRDKSSFSERLLWPVQNLRRALFPPPV